MKKRDVSIVSAAVIIILAAVLYLAFFYYPECKSQECFNSKMEKCSRAHYINEDATALWEYRIKTSFGEDCRISVKALEIKTDLETQNALKGKEMLCQIPKGAVMLPESRLEYCHGLLKESIQELMIKRMQAYVVDNI